MSEDMQAIDQSATFAQKNPTTGLIEIIDCKSGAIIAVQRTHLDLFNGHQEMLIEHTLPNGEKIKLQRGIDPGLVASARARPYSKYIGDLFCAKLAEGFGVTAVCKMEGQPTYIEVCRWKREHPGFVEQIEAAKKDRAEYLRDKALAEAELATSTKDPINAHSLRIDTYKWAASVDDVRYSTKRADSAGGKAPVQIIINTGIQRGEIDGTTGSGIIKDVTVSSGEKQCATPEQVTTADKVLTDPSTK